MKKKNKKHKVEDNDTEDEIKLLEEFANRLDKKNQVLKKILEQKSMQSQKNS